MVRQEIVFRLHGWLTIHIATAHAAHMPAAVMAHHIGVIRGMRPSFSGVA